MKCEKCGSLRVGYFNINFDKTRLMCRECGFVMKNPKFKSQTKLKR